jgi:hypothetical protein
MLKRREQAARRAAPRAVPDRAGRDSNVMIRSSRSFVLPINRCGRVKPVKPFATGFLAEGAGAVLR